VNIRQQQADVDATEAKLAFLNDNVIHELELCFVYKWMVTTPCAARHKPKNNTSGTRMSVHLERRTQVPRDISFFFDEQKYISNLKKYEIQRALFDATGREEVTANDAFVATQVALCKVFAEATSTDSMRYDFIQHYIAHHRSKIHELDAAMSPFDPTTENPVQGILLAQLYRKLRSRKAFHQQQATFLQRVLVHRAGHAAHPSTPLHSWGQQYYDAVAGNVASVYQADKADRGDVRQHGARAHGITAPVYVGDVRQYEDGTLRRYDGKDFVE